MRYKSNMITTGSGKLGGSVASHNRYGDYFRGWKKGVNPKRPLQQAILRAFFASVSALWTTLSDANRFGWSAAAAATPVPDRKWAAQ